MVRKRFVPKMTRAMARMTKSIFESNIALLRVRVQSTGSTMIRQSDYDI
jgi:hypothetical protein